MVDFDWAAVVWRKSSRSAGGNSNCVEVAFLRGFVAVRDSRDPAGGLLIIRQGAWRGFLHLISMA
jgi:hypothetical protein